MKKEILLYLLLLTSFFVPLQVTKKKNICKAVCLNANNKLEPDCVHLSCSPKLACVLNQQAFRDLKMLSKLQIEEL